jgi:hypothetical protein
LWTTTLVRQHIYTRFGIEYGRERVRQLWHPLGLRLRRWRRRHLKATPEAQAACRAALETLLAEWPEEWALLCGDEATVRRHPTLTAPWSLVDEGPQVPTGDDHTKVQVYGAVAPLTGRTHDPISRALSTREVAQCLRHLLVYHPGKQLLVIHDRGTQHQGAPVDAVIREAKGRLSRKAQPAYSPELNPQARIWKWWRRVVTHNHWLVTLQEQIEAIRNFFRYLTGGKVQVRQLCGVNTPNSLVASL